MLWVLNRTVSMRHLFKLMGKEINAILGTHMILIWTYEHRIGKTWSCGSQIGMEL